MPRVSITGASVNIGSVVITPPTPVEGTVETREVTANDLLPAGLLKVEITNLGFVQAGDTNNIIQVDGNDVSPGTPAVVFEATLKPSSNEWITLPAITITNPLGSRVRVTTFI